MSANFNVAAPKCRRISVSQHFGVAGFQCFSTLIILQDLDTGEFWCRNALVPADFNDAVGFQSCSTSVSLNFNVAVLRYHGISVSQRFGILGFNAPALQCCGVSVSQHFWGR